MKTIRKTAVCGILAGAVLVSLLTGCGKKEEKIDGTAPAITVNGETVSVGAANFYLRLQQAESTSMMVNYGLLQEGAPFWDNVYTAATSSAEEETYGDNMKDSIKDSILEGVVLRQHMEEYQVSFPEELESALTDAAAEVMEANAAELEKMGTSEEDVREVLRLLSYRTLMYDAMTADVDREVTDEEAAQTTVTYARASLKTTDSETGEQRDMDEEEKDAVRAELTDLLDQIREADDPETDIRELASAIDEEKIVVSTVSYGKDDAAQPDEVKDAAAGLEDGEVCDEVIETEDNYYVVRLDKIFDEEKTESKKDSILSQRLDDAYDSLAHTWMDDAEVTEEEGWKALKVTDTHAYVAAAPAPAEETSESSAAESTSASSETETTSASSETESESASSAAESTSISASSAE